MTSLYAKYIKEREGSDILENKYGFISYKITKTSVGNIMFVEDLFILPEYRRLREGSSLCNTLIDLAKKENCKQILSGADPNTNGVTDAVKFQLKMGMKILNINNGMINFYYTVED